MNINHIACIFLATILLYSCEKNYNYEDVVKTELESGKIYNHIILDIDFGMTKNDFYDYCWKLNNEKKAGQGPTNRTVKVPIDEISKEAYMLFYPNFSDDQIVEMPILFEYDDWAPCPR